MPHKTYAGKTGIVWNVTKRAIGVEFNKRVSVASEGLTCSTSRLLASESNHRRALLDCLHLLLNLACENEEISSTGADFCKISVGQAR